MVIAGKKPLRSLSRLAPREPLSSSGEEGDGESVYVGTRGGSSAAESEGDALQPQVRKLSRQASWAQNADCYFLFLVSHIPG